MKKYLTINELCEVLKISDATVRRHIKKGLPSIQVGRDYRFDLEEVVEWYKTRKGE